MSVAPPDAPCCQASITKPRALTAEASRDRVIGVDEGVFDHATLASPLTRNPSTWQVAFPGLSVKTTQPSPVGWHRENAGLLPIGSSRTPESPHRRPPVASNFC